MSLSFDTVIEAYEGFKRMSPFATYCETHTLMQSVGESLEGLDVLDLGCGWGCHTKRLAALNPKSLVATDISRDAIAVARHYNRGGDVEFRVEDCAELADVNRYDLIVANLLLPFNETIDKLETTCSRIYSALKPGGRAIGLIPNCQQGIDFSRESVGRQVNGMYEVPNWPKDGDEMHLVVFAQPKDLRFPLRWYHHRTYTNCLLDAGFDGLGQLRFERPIVSNEGVEEFGEKFWSSIVDQPSVWLFVATK